VGGKGICGRESAGERSLWVVGRGRDGDGVCGWESVGVVGLYGSVTV
jgi:hypothetical protein